jgi:hypothetical protein
MTITKKSTATKTLKGHMIYLSEAERLQLTQDLARANTHRKKALSMSEYLRKRLFSLNVRDVEPSVIQAPNYDKLIKDTVQAAIEAANPNPGLLTGDTAKIVNLLEEVITEKYYLTDAAIKQTRKDILNLKDELQTATQRG